MISRKRFWISWYQPTEDPRPVKVPAPQTGILGYWVSGYSGNGEPILCVLVDISAEKGTCMVEAAKLLKKYWPECPKGIGFGSWRIFDEKPINWTPGDRFPMPKPKRRK